MSALLRTTEAQLSQVSSGSIASFRACASHFRFGPETGHIAASQRDGSGAYRDGAGRRSNSGSLAKFAAILRASSLVRRLKTARQAVLNLLLMLRQCGRNLRQSRQSKSCWLVLKG
jgi:hypothetical protein